jgi:membrane-bound serine protease (ClpP class)
VVLTLCLIGSFFVPYPWNIVLLVSGLVLEVGEVIWGRRLARARAKTGVEAMVGRRATVVEPCRPDGKVRLRGELWNATCVEGADLGETVIVLDEHQLTLRVERAEGSSQREDAPRPSGEFS